MRDRGLMRVAVGLPVLHVRLRLGLCQALTQDPYCGRLGGFAAPWTSGAPGPHWASDPSKAVRPHPLRYGQLALGRVEVPISWALSNKRIKLQRLFTIGNRLLRSPSAVLAT